MRSSLFWDDSEVSRRPIGTVFKDEANLELENRTDRLSQNVGYYQSTLCNILEVKISTLLSVLFIHVE